MPEPVVNVPSGPRTVPPPPRRTWWQWGQQLYVRIWLAVVLAVAVLTLLVGWAWRLTTEAPLRELHVRNTAGDIIGSAQRRPPRPPPEVGNGPPNAPGQMQGPVPGAVQGAVPGAMGEREKMGLPPRPGRGPGPAGSFGNGPEFLVTLNDGQVIHIHLPRPPGRSPFSSRPYGFFWMLTLVGLAVALATYPIVRRLTRRLEALQQGVERWGSGDLAARVPLEGHDEVGILATRFNHAASRIETLVTSHKSLLANASHELRSPLARIRMGLELMGSQPSPTVKQEIARNIAELNQLIDEILLASRLDTSEADMGTVETVDWMGLVAEECARHDALFDMRLNDDTTTNTPQAVNVLGVVKLLRRVVRNLLENAHRYSDGPVYVTLQRTSPHTVLRVADRGPGVPEPLRERIFEPFYRLPGASEQAGGVGLGLALVKSITQRMGGDVHCEENPGGGACFVVRLPLAPS